MPRQLVAPHHTFRETGSTVKTVLIPLVGLLLVAAACTSEGTPPPTETTEDVRGELSGSVTIGPLCPVEPCADAGDVYSSRELVLQQPGGVRHKVPLQPDGTFEAVISTGSYTVDLDPCEYPGCDGAFPVSIDIGEGEPAILNIDIDTGIRSPVGAPGSVLTEDTFKALLATEDVIRLSGDVPLTAGPIVDNKAMAASVDPAQTTKMDSWYGVVFAVEERGPGLSFNVIDFDSPSSAQAHFDLVTAEGMQRMDPSIADASAQVELNAQGIGSMLVLLAGDRVVLLHTAQSDDQQPLVSLGGIEELARLVASRL